LELRALRLSANEETTRLQHELSAREGFVGNSRWAMFALALGASVTVVSFALPRAERKAPEPIHQPAAALSPEPFLAPPVSLPAATPSLEASAAPPPAPIRSPAPTSRAATSQVSSARTSAHSSAPAPSVSAPAASAPPVTAAPQQKSTGVIRDNPFADAL
jgi:cytoskeletal protein RodZ